jgi:phage terminase large subunit GpA-like protein
VPVSYEDAKEHLTKTLSSAIRPVPRIYAWQWGESNRVLRKNAGSKEEGPLRFSRTPYMKKILEALSIISSYLYVYFKKSSQVGGTEAGNTWISYLIDVEPGDIMQVYQTDETAKDSGNLRVIPMLESTPSVADKLISSKAKSRKEKSSFRKFINGSLRIVGAQSISKLKSFAVRYIHITEVDEFKFDLKNQGNTIDLLLARTTTYGNQKKIYIESTPTVKGSSQISDLFSDTDQNHYHITCPHCNHKQHLRFEQLVWHKESTDTGKTINYPGTTYYECEAESCKGKIYESQKPELFAKGEWIPLKPENISKEKIGFHINALYSPLGWFSWSDVVTKYLQALEDPRKMKTFKNTILGLEDEGMSNTPDWQKVFEKRESWKLGTIPSERCLFLTAAADIQADRIEVMVRGWGRKNESWVIDKFAFYGDTDDLASDAWKNLTNLLYLDWKHPMGINIPVSVLGIDASFRTSTVLRWCRDYPLSKVVPLMGRDNFSLPISMPKTTQGKNKTKSQSTKRVYFSTTILKEEFYGWIALEPRENGSFPDGFVHLPSNMDEEFVRQMLGENMIYEGNKLKFVKFRRNEGLDLAVMSRAAALTRAVDDWKENRWRAIELQLGYKPDPIPVDNIVEQKPKEETPPNSNDPLKSHKSYRPKPGIASKLDI